MEQNQGDCAGLQTVARGFFVGLVVLAAVIVIGIIAVAAIGIDRAHARDNGQWGEMPANIREWFQELKQPDNRRGPISSSGSAPGSSSRTGWRPCRR